MSNIPQKAREQAHEKIEKAIEASLRESPASVGEIAAKTGYHPSLVHRVYLNLGWLHEGGRWVWQHNRPRHE